MQLHQSAARHQVGVARIFRLTPILLAAVLTSCAYINPYVTGDPPHRAPPASADLRELSAAVNYVDGLLAETQERYRAAGLGGRYLDLLSFGLATGAGVKIIHGSSTRSATNLGLGAAAAYTGSTLFLPRTQLEIYREGARVLSCVRERAVEVMSVTHSASSRSNSDIDSTANAVFGGCQIPASTSAKIITAKRAQAELAATITDVRGADHAMFQRVTTSATRARDEMNKQIDGTRPDPGAILTAAQGLGPMAMNLTAVAPSGPAMMQVAGGGCPRPPSAEEVEKLDDWIDGRADNADKLRQALVKAVNGMAEIDAACVVAALPVTVMTLSQSKLTVVKDATYNVIVTGGREPLLQPRFIGAQPSANTVLVNLVAPRTLVVTGGSAISGTATFTLQVIDSSLVPNKVELTVETK